MRFTVTTPVLCLIVTGIAVAPGALAGTTDSSNTDAPADGARPSDRLQEVVITAEKRVTIAQKTPISITTLSGAQLEATGETELGRALRNVPSLQIQGTPQGGEIYIRGVGANGDSNFLDPSVALSMDGVYTARSERLYAPLYDIARIEVLRGPQGTLYGRNADGGSVNIISNDPTFDGFHAGANIQYGNYDLRHADGYVNLPVDGQLAFRLAGLVEDRTGYFSNGGYSSHVRGFRAKGLYEPSGNLTVKGLVDYSHQYGPLATSVPVPGALPSPPFPAGGWPTEAGNPWYVDPYHPPDQNDFKFLTSAIEVDYAMPWATLVFNPTYSHNTRDYLTNLVVGDLFGPLSYSVDAEDQYTVDLRLNSPDSSKRLRWVGGFYYLWDNDGEVPGIGTTQSANLADGTSVNLFTSYTAGAPPTFSVAGYGQVTYALTRRFSLIAGLRHTTDRKSNAALVLSNYIPGYDSGKVVSTSQWGAWTYSAELEFDPVPASMLYAEIAKGYKAGGYDTTAVPPLAYGPETVLDYELGTKNRFLGDSLQVNASLYFYQYHDLQVQYNPAVSPPLPIPAAYIPSGAVYNYFQQYIANGGNGINKGGELEMKYRLTPYDQFDLSLSYTDAHYGNFAQPDLAGLSGEPMAATPRWTAVPSYSHSFPVGDGLLTVDLDSKLSSSYWTSVNNRGSRPDSFQSAYTRSDASLIFDSGRFWSVSLWVKNIEDHAQIQFGDFPLNRNVINFPRTYGGNFSLRF
jgi:iron complex outermembrane receptor protein